jgi:hypothetical protein
MVDSKSTNNLFINQAAAHNIVLKDCPEDEKKPSSDEILMAGGGVGLLQVTNCFEMA